MVIVISENLERSDLDQILPQGTAKENYYEFLPSNKHPTIWIVHILGV